MAINKFPLRLMPSVHLVAENFSQKEGVSLKHFINVAVAEKLADLQHEEWLARSPKAASNLVAKALQILDRPTRYATQEQDKLPKGYVSIRRKYPGKRLRSLSLSNGRKAKIRNIMHSSFNHAVRWEWHDRNSITLVRQSTKNIPTVLTLAEVEELLLYLEELTRTAVLVDVMTGFRVGELLALKWQDVDFEKSEIHITRSISLQHVSECKTEASRKPVPLDARLAESLRHR